MQVDKVLIVMKHEFQQKLRSRAYVILTLIGPLLFGLLFALPVLFSSVNTVENRQIAIVDSTNVLGSIIAKPDSSVKNLAFRVATNQSVDSLRAQVSSGALTGILVIGPHAIDERTAPAASLRLRNTSDFTAIRTVSDRYEQAVRQERLAHSGINPDTLRKLEEIPDVETMKIAEGAESKDEGFTFAAAYIVGFIIYMSLIMYGTMIMRSVIEEKGSRIVELIVSSIRPFDLLIGKVLGNALAAFLQISVWAIFLGLLATVGVTAMQTFAGINLHLTIPAVDFIYFTVFFVLGFLIYATLYAMAGAMADQDSDSQQASMPITLIVVLGILFMTSVIQAPSSTTSVILSFIPFFTPMLMLARIFSETPPVWQIALSMLIMIATFFGVLSLAGRIYRVGILMYGKRFSFKEALKWLRYS